MIQFVTVEDHVRFAVNLDAVRGAQLSLSSELLESRYRSTWMPPTEVRP